MTLPDWKKDGHPHNRDAHGTCMSCGAVPNEYHYALLPTTPLDRTEPMTGRDFLLAQVTKPPVTGLYLTKAELAKLYVILDTTHGASAEILEKVSNALKGAL